ncbi:phage integrase N-terminal SAM-like domain-containing protein [Propionivibrio soli]|uniref:phage integrase N-terminal SAM-like domain-containing protein n=1 Tax=Propionivibrio soli TaxID=2976531 RepID=UPI003B84668A
MQTRHRSKGTSPRLLDHVRSRIRLKHYSIRTEQAYLDWIRRFIRHFGKRHPGGFLLSGEHVQAGNRLEFAGVSLFPPASQLVSVCPMVCVGKMGVSMHHRFVPMQVSVLDAGGHR